MRECHMCRQKTATNHFQYGLFVKSICGKCLGTNSLRMENNCDVSAAFQLVDQTQSVEESGKVGEACPDCGLIAAKFIVNMRAGCRTCYTTFAGVVDIVAPPDDFTPDDSLSIKLAEAIREERYEDAADLRDLMEANGE